MKINLEHLTEEQRGKIRLLPLTQPEQAVLLRALAYANSHPEVPPADIQVNTHLAMRLIGITRNC